MSKTKPDDWYEQSGVVPYRVVDGRVEVLLITSVKKGNWIVPKGIVEAGFTPADSAMKEALEEAGVVGRVVGDALGTYEHAKWGGTCRVQIFAMHVDKQLDHWPEENVRQRKWLPLDEAIDAIAKRELAEVVERLASIAIADIT